MNFHSIHIVTDKKSPRLEYVLDFIFHQVWNMSYELHLKNQGQTPSENTFFYGLENDSNQIFLNAHPFIFSADNANVNYKTSSFQSFTYPFATQNGGILPFDPFAAIFYFLSQFEEQTDTQPKDIHQRFKVLDSNLAPYIHFPMVDLICKLLKMKLLDLGIKFGEQQNRYSFTPTFDIDIAFAHRAKSLSRHVLGTTKLGMNFKFKELNERLGVWLGRKKDPYFVFDSMLNLFDEFQIKAIFFALVAKNGKFNNNNSISSPLYQNLLKTLSSKHDVFLHSSYHSLDNPDLIQSEKLILESVIAKEIKANRQHFLRFSLPNYWKILTQHAITDDYSQGFYDTWGYRCGTSFPHRAFDVKKNEVLPVIVHPFIFMDTALIKQYQNDVMKVHEKMIEIISNSKVEGTPCIGIWHNYAMPNDSLYFDNFMDVVKYARL